LFKTGTRNYPLGPICGPFPCNMFSSSACWKFISFVWKFFLTTYSTLPESVSHFAQALC